MLVNNNNSKAFFQGYFTEIKKIFPKYEIFLHVPESNPRPYASKASTLTIWL